MTAAATHTSKPMTEDHRIATAEPIITRQITAAIGLNALLYSAIDIPFFSSWVFPRTHLVTKANVDSAMLVNPISKAVRKDIFATLAAISVKEPSKPITVIIKAIRPKNIPA